MSGFHRFRCVAQGVALVTLAGLSVAAVPNADAGHKFHASLTQIEVNAKARTVEVAIRVFIDDLEEALSLRAGRRIRLETASDLDALALDYVQSSVKLDAPDGKRLVFRWIGKEVSVDVVWLYVEAPCSGPIDEGRLENALFFELFDDQVNTVNLKDGKRRATLTFSTGDGARPLAFPTEE